jgi:hypothetical protein
MVACTFSKNGLKCLVAAFVLLVLRLLLRTVSNNMYRVGSFVLHFVIEAVHKRIRQESPLLPFSIVLWREVSMCEYLPHINSLFVVLHTH